MRGLGAIPGWAQGRDVVITLTGYNDDGSGAITSPSGEFTMLGQVAQAERGKAVIVSRHPKASLHLYQFFTSYHYASVDVCGTALQGRCLTLFGKVVEIARDGSLTLAPVVANHPSWFKRLWAKVAGWWRK